MRGKVHRTGWVVTGSETEKHMSLQYLYNRIVLINKGRRFARTEKIRYLGE